MRSGCHRRGRHGGGHKARDTRLDRSVAIKVLPPAFQRRFGQARAVRAGSQGHRRACNHPHICTLHDVGRQQRRDTTGDGHLTGETLAARLEKGAAAAGARHLQLATEIATPSPPRTGKHGSPRPEARQRHADQTGAKLLRLRAGQLTRDGEEAGMEDRSCHAGEAAHRARGPSSARCNTCASKLRAGQQTRGQICGAGRDPVRDADGQTRLQGASAASADRQHP